MKNLIKFIVMISLLVGAAILLTNFQQSMQDLQKHSLEFDAIHPILYDLQVFTGVDPSQVESTLKCRQDLTRQCGKDLSMKMRALPQDQKLQVVTRLQQQGQEFQQFIDGRSQSKNLALYNSFLQKVKSDPVTGSFWVCIDSAIKQCGKLVEEEFFQIGKATQDDGETEDADNAANDGESDGETEDTDNKSTKEDKKQKKADKQKAREAKKLEKIKKKKEKKEKKAELKAKREAEAEGEDGEASAATPAANSTATTAATTAATPSANSTATTTATPATKAPASNTPSF